MRWLVEFIIKHYPFSLRARTALTNTLIGSIAIPIRAAITVRGGRIFINGKQAEPEMLLSLHEAADAVLKNQARKLIHEQVRFMALDKGFLGTDDPTQQLFYKAALWYSQEENNLLEQLAGSYSHVDSP